MRRKVSRANIGFLLLCGLLPIIWLTGGASRADVLGQVVVRAIAWVALIAACLIAPMPRSQGIRPVIVLLVLAILLPLAQLIPLPPQWWLALPGRDLIAQAARVTGQPQPWRPISLVPDATANALASLVVPVAVLVLAAGLTNEQHRRLPNLLLGLVGASMLLGLLQFSGAGFNNPLVNDTVGQVSGSFANRNHFALFLALGCLIAPVWSTAAPSQSARFWRVPVAWGLVLLFLLTIVASGSRAGLGLGMLAVLLAFLLSRGGMKRALAHFPRWLLPAFGAGVVVIIALLLLLIVMNDRAASIDRLFVKDVGQDMRIRGLPTVISMIGTYFPIGSGLGGFDPVFRISEPFELLKLTYFNHAHNDFLELTLDAGLPAALLLTAGMGWWAWATLRVWRGRLVRSSPLPLLGSAIILLVLIASLFDYPARTPVIMALVVLAAVWLGRGTVAGSSALPHRGEHL